MSNKVVTPKRGARPRSAILAQISDAEYSRLAKFLVAVDLPLGKILSEPNEPIEYAYFLNTGMISTDALTKSGDSVEIGLIGREGFAGLTAVFDQPRVPHLVIIQGAGAGLRIKASVLREEFLRGGELQRLVHSFAYLQMVQVAQSVLCNSAHEIESRLARWLLFSADRTEADELQLTQEFLSQMLGVQRSSVTVAASALQRAGMIEYSRGKIRITDAPLLRKAACECYEVVREAYDRLLKIDDENNLRYV